MHLDTAEGDLVDLLLYEVAEDSHGFAVLAIDGELAAAGVLVHCDEGTPLRLRHDVELGLDDVDACRLYRMRVPQVDSVDDKLRRDTLEEVVTVVVLVHVAFHVSRFLEEQISVGGSGLGAIDLGFADELAAG